MESWPSGRRHLPAKKACGHKPASRVRISYSPPEHFDLKDINKFNQKKEKLLDSRYK